MTFNKKKLEEFESLVGYLNANYGVDEYREFIKQALIDKEQEVLERVYKCLPEKKLMTGGHKVENDDLVSSGFNLCLKKTKDNLEKEFKQ